MSQELIFETDLEEDGSTIECRNEDAPAKQSQMTGHELSDEEAELLEVLDGRGAPLIHPCGPGVGGD